MKSDAESRAQLVAELAELRAQVAQWQALDRWQQVMLRVREAVASMRQPEDVETVLVVIREGLEALGVPFRGCGVNIIDAVTLSTVAYHHMVAQEEWLRADPDAGGGIIRRIWERGEVAYRTDLEADDPFCEKADLEALFSYPVRAVIDIPFSHGTLALNSSSAHPFSDRDIGFLKEMAASLSWCYQRMDDIRTLETRNRELEKEIAERAKVEQRLGERDRLVTAFHQIGQTILSTLDSEKILDEMGVQIAEAGIFRSLMIALVDDTADSVEVVRTFYRTEDGALLRNDSQIVGIRYPLSDVNITAEVARTGEMRVVDEWDESFDVRVDSPATRRGKVSYFIPVQQGQRVVAVLATGSEHEEKSSVIGRIEAMHPLLDQIAIALEHARLYEEAQREIRERRRAQEERAQLEVRLQRVEKMELVGTLAGGVAHDLNNILSGIVGFPDLMLMGMPQDNPLRAHLVSIREAGLRAAAIVQDLLTLARRGVTVDKVVCLNDIVSAFLGTPEHDEFVRRYPGVVVDTDLADDLLSIMGSPVHLGKTVMNLVANAMEAMPGGGQLTISTENGYLDRPIHGYDEVAEGDYAILRVADTGTGVAPEDMERIFEPFYTKKQMGRSGTGLGMSVVWGTVKDHRGYIDLQSTVGTGTTFTLYFSVTRLVSGDDSASRTSPDYLGRGESILVIDDADEQRELASAILTRLGYSVATVAGGDEALDYLLGRPVDLLVLDMIMEGGMDGLDTYRRILELHPGQRAIIASGYSQTDRVRETQQLGAGAFVKKPYLLEKLGMAVRAELDRSCVAPD